MKEVISRLFIGNWMEASENAGSMYVVTCACDSPFTGNARFDLIDGPGNNLQTILDAADHVAKAHAEGKTVFVHCQGGRSRSGIVTVLAMVKITGKSFCECYDALAIAYERTRIHPHLSLLVLESMR